MNMRKHGLGHMMGAAILAVATGFSGAVAAKSLYVIANQNPSCVGGAGCAPIQTYDIQGSPTELVYQAEYVLDPAPWGAVGLAIDPENAKLFVTFEGQNEIRLLDAVTFADLGSTFAPTATNLAGIAMDMGQSRVYSVDRYTNNLYVYDWDASTNTLTGITGSPFALTGVTAAYGIALDELQGRIYVADGSSSTVNYFSTSDFSNVGSFALETHSPIGIAVDQVRNFVYTGAAFNGSYSLVKYDLNTDVESGVPINPDLAEGAMGIAVDEETGNVYITTGFSGDRLIVYDSNLNELRAFSQAEIQAFGGGNNWGDPTGITIPRTDIGFNPLNLTMVGSPDPVPTGSDLTYTLCYDNLSNDYDLTGVTITLDIPVGTTFVSTDREPDTVTTTTLTWNIGTVPAGAVQSCYGVVFNVTAEPGDVIDGNILVENDQTGPTTVAAAVAVDEFVPTAEITFLMKGEGGSGAGGPLELLLLATGLGFAARRRRQAGGAALLFATLLALGLAPAVAPAAGPLVPGWYIGGSGGWTSSDYSDSDLRSDLVNKGYAITSVSVDDTDTGWKVFGGYQFNQNWAIETSWVDLGDVTSTVGGTIDDAQVPALLSDAASNHGYLGEGATLAGVAIWPVTPQIAPFLKLGAFSWKADVDIKERTTGQSISRNRSGTDMMGGLGLRYTPTPNLEFRAEYEYYDIDPDAAGFFSLGIGYHF